MNKPISMAINETKTNLLQVCNQSGLHPSILELIVKDLYDTVKYVSSVQLKQDEENCVKKEKNDKNTDNSAKTNNK